MPSRIIIRTGTIRANSTTTAPRSRTDARRTREGEGAGTGTVRWWEMAAIVRGRFDGGWAGRGGKGAVLHVSAKGRLTMSHSTQAVGLRGRGHRITRTGGG